jgi:hypothetical protein
LPLLLVLGSRDDDDDDGDDSSLPLMLSLPAAAVPSERTFAA